MRECVKTRDFGVPLLREARDALAIRRIHPVTDPRERLECHPRIRRDGDPALLVHVELGDVHVHEPLVRVPIPITTSASFAARFAADVPVAPIAPSDAGWSYGRDPLPACVSATG